MTTDLTCLYSTIKNNSGVSKIFGFLPPHGRRLLADEEFTVFGDIRQAVIRDERATARRNIIAFEAAIARGDLVILSTAAPVLQDPDSGDPKMLVIESGNLALADPCWSTSLTGEAPNSDV